MRFPELSLYDHQHALTLDLDHLSAMARAALPLVLPCPGGETPVLPELAEVEISFITDEAIAAVHREFMDDPAPTDVITFHHGEILISTETAVRQAAVHGQLPERETVLYLIHGLLHLNGHEDRSAQGYGGMRDTQERILQQVWPVSAGKGNRGTG